MSLWIYLVVAGILAIIWSFVLPGTPKKTKQGASLDDLEESLNSFTSGMEEDNRQLNSQIESLKLEHDRQKSDLMSRIEYLEKRSRQIEDDTRRVARTVEEEIVQQARQSAQRMVEVQTVPAPEPQPEEQHPETLLERYPELFELYQQGKSIEFIAKKIGKEKGEVILIIDLAKQGEEI